MASPPQSHLLVSLSFLIISLPLFLMFPVDSNFSPSTPSSLNLPSGRNSPLGTFSTNHSGNGATYFDNKEKGVASIGSIHYSYKKSKVVFVAWAVGFGFIGLFALGAWLMRRLIKKNMSKVVAFDDHHINNHV